MGRLEWKEDYSVGVRVLDEQHRQLLDIINQLDSARPENMTEKFFFATLNLLVKYADVHFSIEEKYMREYGYPRISEHEDEHRKFTEHVFMLRERLAANDPGLFPEIQTFLRDWYISHVLGTDRGYVPLFAHLGIT